MVKNRAAIAAWNALLDETPRAMARFLGAEGDKPQTPRSKPLLAALATVAFLLGSLGWFLAGGGGTQQWQGVWVSSGGGGEGPRRSTLDPSRAALSKQLAPGGRRAGPAGDGKRWAYVFYATDTQVGGGGGWAAVSACCSFWRAPLAAMSRRIPAGLLACERAPFPHARCEAPPARPRPRPQQYFCNSLVNAKRLRRDLAITDQADIVIVYSESLGTPGTATLLCGFVLFACLRLRAKSSVRVCCSLCALAGAGVPTCQEPAVHGRWRCQPVEIGLPAAGCAAAQGRLQTSGLSA